MGKVDGAALVAKSLKQQGVEHRFGIVGFAVQPIAAAARKAAIIMRNAQAASNAAQAAGYLTSRRGACLGATLPLRRRDCDASLPGAKVRHMQFR